MTVDDFRGGGGGGVDIFSKPMMTSFMNDTLPTTLQQNMSKNYLFATINRHNQTCCPNIYGILQGKTLFIATHCTVMEVLHKEAQQNNKTKVQMRGVNRLGVCF